MNYQFNEQGRKSEINHSLNCDNNSSLSPILNSVLVFSVVLITATTGETLLS